MARLNAVIHATEGQLFSVDSSAGVEFTDGADVLPFRLDDFAGLATFRGKPIFNQEQIIDQIDSGRILSGKTITFGFLDKSHGIGLYNNPNYAAFFTEPNGMSEFSETQKTAARESLALWDDLIPQDIVEKNGVGADILFTNTTTGPGQAHAYYPGNGGKYQSDIWTASPVENWTNEWLNYNGYGATTLIHEAGHALGLSHPGAYNFGPGFAVNYVNGAEYAQDSEQFSIMSYWDPRETGATPLDVETGLLGNAQTPLLHDILTIQAKYGADPTTRAGDTTYGFNSNAGRDIYDFSSNQTPYLSIYDAGGEDTLDLSGAESGVFLDLRPGSFSSAAVRPTLAEANAAIDVFNAATDAFQGDFAHWTAASQNTYLNAVGINRSRQIADATDGLVDGLRNGIQDVRALSYNNISIAYNTVIENAVGGSQRDYLLGNHVANKLSGNGGNDVLNGLGGDDILTGGAGADEFRFTDLGGTDKITDFASGSDKIHLTEIDANSGVAGNQNFTFVGSNAFSNTAGELRTFSQGGSNFLAGDVDGNGVADFLINLGNATIAPTDILF